MVQEINVHKVEDIHSDNFCLHFHLHLMIAEPHVSPAPKPAVAMVLPA